MITITIDTTESTPEDTTRLEKLLNDDLEEFLRRGRNLSIPIIMKNQPEDIISGKPDKKD